MPETLFLQMLNMSFTASIVIFFVLIARLLLFLPLQPAEELWAAHPLPLARGTRKAEFKMSSTTKSPPFGWLQSP